MSRFDDQINRMRELCTYGRIDEDEKIVNRSIEHKETAADGVTYGIIRECSKFYIESCPKGKENLVEAYDYLGGFNNRKDYEYTSYPMALKQFKIKMDSINESVHAETDTDVIEAQNQQLMTEGGTKMQQEIARMKQIMRNAAIVMNESSEMMTGAVSAGKSADKDTPFTDEVKACENGGECAASSASDPEKQGKPFAEKPKTNDKVNEEKCCQESEGDAEEVPEITDDVDADDEMGTGEEGMEDFDTDGEDEGNDNEEDEPDVELDADDDAEGEDNLDDVDDAEGEDGLDDVEDAEGEDDIDDFEDAEGEDEFDDFEGAEGEDDFDGFENVEDEDDIDDFEDAEGEDEFDEFEDEDYISESMNRRMDRIVESIINKYKSGKGVNEDRLNDFGRHPGYRKKPFSLPPTGEDSNAHGKDINHDSVHNEKPFGMSKGDSTPFSILVDKVYKDVAGKVLERHNLENAIMEDVLSKLKKKVK